LKAIQIAQFKFDLKQMIAGHNTEIGEKGYFSSFITLDLLYLEVKEKEFILQGHFTKIKIFIFLIVHLRHWIKM
jgi:hypothetical protein